MSDATVTNEAPVNSPEARLPGGTLKDQGNQSENTNPSPENTTPASTEEGKSFLNGKPPEKPELKTEEPKLDADGKPIPPEKKPDTPEGAPEKYADFKLPDGFKFNEAALGAAQATFKELGLSQEAAQKLVDTYAKNTQTAVEAPYKEWSDLQKTWLSDIQDRFGSKAEVVRTDISKAIDSALPPSLAKAFRGALDLTGAGSNPDVVEALSIMFKPFVEGGSLRPGGPSPEANKPPGAPNRPTVADALYPHLAQNRS